MLLFDKKVCDSIKEAEVEIWKQIILSFVLVNLTTKGKNRKLFTQSSIKKH